MYAVRTMQRGAHEKTPEDSFRDTAGYGGLWWADGGLWWADGGLWWADGGLWWDMVGYAGICRDMPGYAGICRDMPGYGGIWVRIKKPRLWPGFVCAGFDSP